MKPACAPICANGQLKSRKMSIAITTLPNSRHIGDLSVRVGAEETILCIWQLAFPICMLHTQSGIVSLSLALPTCLVARVWRKHIEALP